MWKEVLEVHINEKVLEGRRREGISWNVPSRICEILRDLDICPCNIKKTFYLLRYVCIQLCNFRALFASSHYIKLGFS